MVIRFLAVLALLLPAIASAAVTAEQLRRHVEMLASDAFQGRAPGTEGEARTIAYIRDQFEALGLEPGGDEGAWYQPVPLVARKPIGLRSRWIGRGAPIALGEENLILVGSRAEERIGGAPVVFAGHGAVMPEHDIDQLAGARIEGAVVLILYRAPDMAGFPSFNERIKAVSDRGAAAVIGIIGADIPWRTVRQIYGNERTRLQSERVAPVQGVVSQEAATRLAAAAGAGLESLLNGASGPAFRAVRLDLKANLEVRSAVRALTSNNVIGRLRGRESSGQSLMFLGHWDHLGVCRPEGAADRICNGAVDNASGIAAMIEIARGLAKGPRLKRDVLFLATTSEEVGLLGARHFAAHPTVPLDSIVAAFNLDTVAISGKGQKVAVIGRGIAPLDALIEETVREAGREMDEDQEADDFLERQDGWALRRAGVPALMVGGSFSDMAELGRFLSGPYHKPNDDLGRPIELGGAAQDAELLIALGRKLADPARYQPPPPLARP